MADKCTRNCQASRSDSEKGAWTGRELIGPMEEPEFRITSLSRTRAPSSGFRSHSWKERLPAYRLPWPGKLRLLLCCCNNAQHKQTEAV